MKAHLLLAALSAAALSTTPLAAQQEGARQEAPTMAEGAQVYAATCGRCHNPRAGTERTDAEWIPIVAHMRARANLTKRQAEAVLVFLQATNLPETGGQAGDDGARLSQLDVVVPTGLVRALAEIAALREADGVPPEQATAHGNREPRQ